jgi:glutathione S-transferase
MRPENTKRVMVDLDPAEHIALMKASPSVAFRLLQAPGRIRAIVLEWLATQGVALPPASTPRPAGRPLGATDSPTSPRAKKRRRKEARRSKIDQEAAVPSETVLGV